MILISGSSEREIVDLQQGDYEEMDQLAIAKPVAKAAYRVLHAEDIGVGIARAIRAAVSGRPGGVYLDLPAKLFAQTIDAGREEFPDQGRRPGAEADPGARSGEARARSASFREEALDHPRQGRRVCASRFRNPKRLIEKTGIPYLPMSMAKGLLPDTHEQCASAARSFVLPAADVVMLIGARLNWLLSHGKGKTWGGKGHKDWGGQKFIQVDISPQEADSNVRTDAPVVGDIGSCVSALLAGMGSNWAKPPAEWLNAINEKKKANIAKMAETLAKSPSPMNFHSALNVVRDIVKANPDAMFVNEGANALDFTRSIVDMYKPRKRIDVGTWGVMGIGMGYCVAAAVVTKQPVIAIEGDSAFGFSGMEVETICRYNLPVCIVIMNNNGVYKGTDVNPRGGDVAPTVFVKDARYEKLMEAFGGVGVYATTPAELRKAMEEALRSRKPTLINAVIDETAGTESGRITSLNPAAKRNTSRRTEWKHSRRIRILDMSHVQAGPTGTQLMAWMGADVIKLGNPTRRHHARAAARRAERRQPVLHDAQLQQALDHHQHEVARGQPGGGRAAEEVGRRDREFRSRGDRPARIFPGRRCTRSTRASSWRRSRASARPGRTPTSRLTRTWRRRWAAR